MENNLEDILLEAKKWSLFLLVIVACNCILLIMISNFIGLVIQSFLVFFLYSYQRACKAGIDRKSANALEEASYYQKNIFIIVCIQAALLIFGVIGNIVAIIIS